MKNIISRYWFAASLVGLSALVVTACASMATPTGGEYDFDPPKIVRTSPKFNAINYTGKKIMLEFDENVTIEKPSEKVIITPPQKNFPLIQSINKKVLVELKDSLMANTTYTIDFTDAIVDNNEKNPFENFSFSFSTGNVVDSLAVSGKVFAADNLEPMKGIYVGLHSNLDDSTFIKTKFLRISKTNDLGMFTIRGVAPGRYRLFALDDANRDYKYDNPSEAIAFWDQIIEPTTSKATRMDTVKGGLMKGAVDTIKTVQYTRFIPDDIVLRLFKSDFKRQYLQKFERNEHALSFFFGAKTTMPKLEPLNFDPQIDWAILEKNVTNDTLVYWLKDKQVAMMDTLRFKIDYIKTDTLNENHVFTDTLFFFDRTRQDRERQGKKKTEKEKKKKDKEEDVKIDFLPITTNLASAWDVYKDINLEFSEPIIADSLKSLIKLQLLVDTIATDADYQLIVDSLNPRKYAIKRKWNYGESYKLSIDSASIFSIYGLFNDKINQTLKVKTEDQYGKLAINIAAKPDSIPAFVELLDKSDKPIRKVVVKSKVAVFRNLQPGEYYARLVFDTNSNSVWDTGNYYQNVQPEEVYYCNKKFVIKANFEIVEDWDISALAIDKQKPLEITKNKPKENTSKKKEMEQRDKKNEQQLERNQQQQRQNSGSLSGGTSGSNRQMSSQTGLNN